MARAGILYSQVATTAQRLFDKGENPTVDKVREALGNTGSKSTIAPLLKRWKTEQEGLVSETQTGLPVELVSAVKQLYDQAQRDAALQIERMQAEMTETQVRLEAQLKEVQEEVDAGNQHISRLQAALAKKETAFDALTATHNAAQIDNARLQSDVSGLQLRLTDRQEDIKGLQQQLQQTRTQFEEYQETTTQRRDEERRQYEQAKTAINAELSETRRHITERDTTIASQALQMSALEVNIETLQTVQVRYQALQETHTKLSQHLNTQTALAVELSNRHEVTAEALLEAQKELAILRNERPQLLANIHALEATAATHNQELQALRIDKARLEQQLVLAVR
jgi:chromosome segregation ATPase